MPTQHLYAPVTDKVEESNGSDFEEYFHLKSRILEVPRIHLVVFVASIIISFIAGGLTHPFQWPSHPTQDIYGDNDQLRNLNSLVPKCELQVMHHIYS
jgi:hypothetical protein